MVKNNQSDVGEKLTSTEMGKLWAIYLGNTMSVCVLGHCLNHVEDKDIKKVVEGAIDLSEQFIKTIKSIFDKESFPIPQGFTDKDVNMDAPRLFSDVFYLHYLKYVGKAGLSIYSIAAPLVTRKDVVDFFTYCVNSTVRLLEDLNKVLLAKGIMDKPPIIPIPDKADYITDQSYMKGYFGDVRPLHALEITHLFDNIENDVTSKALLVAFNQVASEERVKKFFQRGNEITTRHVDECAKKLHKSGLPSLPFLDDMVSTSTFAPFSDRLMVFHKIDMFSMKIRSYANGLSLSGRRDLSAMYSKFLLDVGLYVEDGANIMIDHGWMEQPPGAPDREELSQ